MDLSADRRLRRDSVTISHVGDYDAVYEIVGGARRTGQGVQISEVHPERATIDKWFIWDVFNINGIPHYWLIDISSSAVFSFCVRADTGWPTSFVVRLVPLDEKWVEMVSQPHHVTPLVKKASDLHYLSPTTGTYRQTPKSSLNWGCIWRRHSPELVDKLPLGTMYRALGVGAIIPVFRLSDRLIGVTFRVK